jgi:hypothetical protein
MNRPTKIRAGSDRTNPEPESSHLHTVLVEKIVVLRLLDPSDLLNR